MDTRKIIETSPDVETFVEKLQEQADDDMIETLPPKERSAVEQASRIHEIGSRGLGGSMRF